MVPPFRKPIAATDSTAARDNGVKCTDSDSKRGRCRSSPLWGWGHIGCESEAALADSVSHTFFHLILLFGGGCADIEEHNRLSKVVLAALLPTKRPQLTALSPSHCTDAVARSECSTTEGLH